MPVRSLRLSTRSWDHHAKQSPRAHIKTWAVPLPARSPGCSTHLPSLTHQPQYGSLACAHFSQSEYLWQSCTGNRYTWKNKCKAKLTTEDGIRRWKHLWTQLISCGSCIITLRAQPDFNKIHLLFSPLTKSKFTHFFLLFFPLQYYLTCLQNNVGHCCNQEWWASLTKIELLSYITCGNLHLTTETASAMLWIQEAATAGWIISKG